MIRWRTAPFRLMPFACFALLAALDPAVAVTTHELCGSAPGPQGSQAYPTDAELIAAADATEARLGGANPPAATLDAALAALAVPGSAAQAPSSGALAQYCTAAGEVMRLSVQGSQVQAQTYLMTGFRAAQAAGEERLSSRAAYRLGLVSVSGGAGGTRGSGGGSSSREVPVTEAAALEPCNELADRSLANTSNAYLSMLALQCASARAKISGDPALSALASLRLARLALAISRGPAVEGEALRGFALERALEALPTAAKVPQPALRAELAGRLVGTAIDLGAADQPALRAGIAVMRQDAGGNPAATSFADALEARLALLAGDRAGAQQLIEQAILAESQRALPARLPEYYLLLGEADPARRERHVFAGYTALNNLRPSLPRIDPVTEEPTFSLYMRDVFERAVEVQLASVDAAREGIRIRAAQEIVEAYRQAELQSAVGSECLPPRDPVKPQDLAAGEILLYPLLLPDRVELLYVSGTDAARGDTNYRRLPANRAANRQEVARLVEEMVLSTTYGEDEAWREPAKRLYDILIRPIEGQLQPGATLAIIPDGALRNLPFAALLDGNGKFLVQKTRLTVAPALAYLQPGGAEEEKKGMRVVAASLERQITLPAGFFAKLNGTAAEAKVAAASGAPGQLIENFRRADLVQAMAGGDVDVLHLATHASFNGRSDRAFIVANGEVIRLSELRDIIAGNRARGEELDLLVLSACETAVGDDESSMGLAGAAVQAGALSAIASLWQVDDVGTGQLMKGFYSHYGAGLSRSEALRAAQVAMIEGGGSNARPHIWAAFMLLGAWR